MWDIIRTIKTSIREFLCKYVYVYAQKRNIWDACWMYSKSTWTRISLYLYKHRTHTNSHFRFERRQVHLNAQPSSLRDPPSCSLIPATTFSKFSSVDIGVVRGTRFGIGGWCCYDKNTNRNLNMSIVQYTRVGEHMSMHSNINEKNFEYIFIHMWERTNMYPYIYWRHTWIMKCQKEGDCAVVNDTRATSCWVASFRGKSPQRKLFSTNADCRSRKFGWRELLQKIRTT